MSVSLLSSDISQKPEGNQRARKSLIRSNTRQSRGFGLIANQFPKLDGRLQGFHVYAGHLCKLASGFDRPVCQMGCQRKRAKRIAGRFDCSQSRYLLVEKLQLGVVLA